MKEYKYLKLEKILAFVPQMEKLKISQNERSKAGFLTIYANLNGKQAKLPLKWRIKRDEFIRRHLPDYRSKPTLKKRLALIAWAYMPYK